MRSSKQRSRTVGGRALVVAAAWAAVASGFGGEARAVEAVLVQPWETGVANEQLGLGETLSASGSATGSAMAGNPLLDGSAWAHVGRWWNLELPEAPAVRIRVTAADPTRLAPGVSVWATGDAPFDGGTEGFGGETSEADWGTPHSFNAYGPLGDPGTLWMADGQGGNAKELIGTAIAGPSYTGETGWGESIENGAHDRRATDAHVLAVTGSVGEGFVELLLAEVTPGWFTFYVGGTDHARRDGGAFTLSVTAIPEPGTALLVGLGVALLGRARPRA